MLRSPFCERAHERALNERRSWTRCKCDGHNLFYFFVWNRVNRFTKIWIIPPGSYSPDHYLHRTPQILTHSSRTEKEMRVDKKQASEFFFNICLH